MSMHSAAPVAIQGISSGTILIAGLQVLFGGGAVAAIIAAWPKLKAIANNREANLLEERADEMKTMRETIAKLSARLDIKEIQHEAERSYDRHRINNFATALKAFFILVKRHPDDAAGAAAEIEAMRTEQIEGEKLEAIALRNLIAGLTAPKGEATE